jgi:hypothetical protein
MLWHGPRGAKNLPEHTQKQPDHRLQGHKIGGNGGIGVLEKKILKQCIRKNQNSSTLCLRRSKMGEVSWERRMRKINSFQI